MCVCIKICIKDCIAGGGVTVPIPRFFSYGKQVLFSQRLQKAYNVRCLNLIFLNVYHIYMCHIYKFMRIRRNFIAHTHIRCGYSKLTDFHTRSFCQPPSLSLQGGKTCRAKPIYSLLLVLVPFPKRIEHNRRR